MGVNTERSMNAEMLEGSVDGTYRRLVPDRSNYPDPDRKIARAAREVLSDTWYNAHEAYEKITPDGRVIKGRT